MGAKTNLVRELLIMKSSVYIASRKQFRLRTPFHNLTILYHADKICITDRTQPVCNYHRCTPL